MAIICGDVLEGDGAVFIVPVLWHALTAIAASRRGVNRAKTL